MRYTRKFAVVTIEKIDEDCYRVTDGEFQYEIDKETLEKVYTELL